MSRAGLAGLLLILPLLLVPGGVLAATGEVREAVCAGKFYPSSPAALKQMLRELYQEIGRGGIEPPPGKRLTALVMPHAGYIYSGRTAAHAALALDPETCSKVVICAPDHRVGFRNAAVSRADAYETPLGKVFLHPDAARLRSRYEIFRHVPACDRQEHAVEVILPFLQTRLANFRIVPIVMGPGRIGKYTEAIAEIYDRQTLLVVSSDLSHYLSHEEAEKRDRQTIDRIEDLNEKALAAGKNRACGATPLRVLIRMARHRSWEPRLLFYENSGDTAGSRRRVVGYAAIAFYGEEAMEQSTGMSEEKGRLLVELARETIARELGQTDQYRESVESRLTDEIFQARRGTFVTLTKNKQLRGCIGNLVPDKPLKQGVQENAINAAFRDPRFSPLSRDELDQVEIEVSLLSEPQPLDYKDADDLLAKLRPGVDGVILRKGMHSSTFLPQVWEQLPEKEMFLSHLCMKAGLPGDAWKTGDLEILTYQVQYFEEHD